MQVLRGHLSTALRGASTRALPGLGRHITPQPVPVAPGLRQFWFKGDDDDDDDKKGDGKKKPRPSLAEKAASKAEKDGDVDESAGEAESASQGASAVLLGGSEEQEQGSQSALTSIGSGDNSPKLRQIIALSTLRRPLFPAAVQPLHLTHTPTVEALLKAQTEGNNYVGVFLKRPSADGTEPEFPELISDLSEVYQTGTFAQIHNIAQSPDGEHHQVFLMGHRRVELKRMLDSGPPARVQVDHWDRLEYDADSKVIKAYRNEIVNTLREVVRMNPLFRESLQQISVFTQRIDMHDPFKLADFAASLTTANGEELQKVLEERDASKRLSQALDLLARERELSKIQEEINRDVEQRISEGQRKYFLMEQHKQIKKELGLEREDKDLLVQKFRERLAALEEKGGAVPEEISTVITEELSKLEGLEKGSSEFNLTRNYLDWLTAMPYGVFSPDNFDVKKAQEVLDADHYGLDDVKRRIREFIAVGKLRGSVQGKILCFVGPPGVGKTSIGKSIAAALDREFYRFSVGGLSDVAAIKGHRRTYVGAMPGQLIQCLKSTGSANPVVLIDEVDKLGRGYQGDPASALLELLDPAQNGAFTDHYLDVPMDLSKVLFLCTANVLDTIPGPLLDRMEVIRVAGYDLPEKLEIAKRYLIPKSFVEAGLRKDPKAEKKEQRTDVVDGKQAEDHAVKVPDMHISDPAIEELIRRYCREAGVRNLEKHVEKICRKLALGVVENLHTDGAEQITSVTPENLPDFVGKPVFMSDRLYDTDALPPGVVMGLAWTAMGGSSLYIETSFVRRGLSMAATSPSQAPAGASEPPATSPAPSFGGGGRFVTTGQMGSVMEESARIAVSVARKILSTTPPGHDAASGAAIPDAVQNFFDQADVHLHVPEGATPKDGPSAGVTMITALVSLATDVPVRGDVAMTGEVSLTGKVLPVGGIKEKTIAARRAGVTTLVFPHGNRADVDELPDYLKEGIEIHFAEMYADVQKVAFAGQEKRASA